MHYLMKKILKSLKPYLIWLFPIAVILVVFYLFFDKITSRLKSLFSKGFEYENLNDSKSSLTDLETSRIVEGLYSAMSNFGTNEARIFSLLSNLNEHDYNKISNKFQERYYVEWFGTWGDSITGVPTDLRGWLNHELSNSDLIKLSLLTNGYF